MIRINVRILNSDLKDMPYIVNKLQKVVSLLFQVFLNVKDLHVCYLVDINSIYLKRMNLVHRSMKYCKETKAKIEFYHSHKIGRTHK